MRRIRPIFGCGPVVFALAAVLFLCCGARPLRAQAGAPDPSFTLQPVSAYQVFEQPDGKILLTGAVGLTSNVSRLNADGTVDTAFATSDEATDNFDPILVFNGSYAYVAQYPPNVGYTTQYMLRRYDWDTGQRDNAFESVTVPGTYVSGFYVYANGQILVWGDVLYRRNADGSVDNTFTPITIPANASLNVNVAADGTTYLSGNFTSFGGVACKGLVRLTSSGAVDPQFLPNLGTGAYIDQVFPESSGTLLVSFSSTQYDQTIARVESNGTVDSTFHQAVFGAPGYTTEYNIVGEMPDQSILLFGYITAVDGVPVGDLAELNSDGTLNTAFAPADYDPAIIYTTTFAYNPTILPNGQILLGGSVYRRDIQVTVPFVRLNADGSRDTAFDTIPENPYPDIGNDRADAYCIQTDGKIVADFQNYNPGGGGGGVTLNFTTAGTLVPASSTPVPFITRYLGDGLYPPHCPNVLSADSISPSLTQITWNAVANETGYQVQRNENGTWVTIGTVGADVTTYNDTTADGVTNFQYCVEAMNANGFSIQSPEVTASLPTNFTTFTATVNSLTQVTLNWVPVTDAWRYDIYRYNGLVAPGYSPDTEMTKIGSVSSTSTTYVDSTALALQTYTYGIIAVNVAGTSYDTSSAVTTYDVPLPPTPGNFLAASNAQQITLIWAPISGTIGYQIERSTNGISGWQVIATPSASAYEFNDSPSTTPGQTFYYRITAINGAGDSPVSEVISATTQAPGWLPAGALDTSFVPSQTVSNVISDRMSPNGTLFYDSYYYGGYYNGIDTLDTLSPAGVVSSINSPIYPIFDYLPFADGTYLLSYGSAPTDTALHVSGANDAPFPTFSNGEVDHFTQLSSGQVLATGHFTAVNGQASNGIARVNADGSLDTTFSMTGIGPDPIFIVPIEQSNGDVIVSSDGATLVRLLPNGTIDPTFGATGSVKLTFPSNPQSVEAVDAQDNIILTGAFTQIDDGNGPVTVSTGIVRLTPNGLIDSSFQPGAGLPNGSSVNLITIDPAGRVLLAGSLTTYNNIPCANLIRLTSDGELDPTFLISPTLSSANFVLSADGQTFYMGNPLLRYLYAPSTTNTQTFSQWATFYSTSGASTTPRNDGVPNLLKYLFDINPSSPMTISERAALPTLDMTTTGGTTYLTLTYHQYAALTGITINVQTSSDLQSWTTLEPSDVPPDFLSKQVGADSTTGDPIMEVGVKMNGSQKQFIRLNVTSP